MSSSQLHNLVLFIHQLKAARFHWPSANTGRPIFSHRFKEKKKKGECECIFLWLYTLEATTGTWPRIFFHATETAMPCMNPDASVTRLILEKILVKFHETWVSTWVTEGHLTTWGLNSSYRYQPFVAVCLKTRKKTVQILVVFLVWKNYAQNEIPEVFFGI